MNNNNVNQNQINYDPQTGQPVNQNKINYSNQNISQPSYNYSQPSFNNNQNFNKKNNNWKNVVSLIIGIASIVLVFISSIPAIPLSIVGLVFGILARKENKKYKIGLILNIISLIIAIATVILYLNIISTPMNKVVGTWNCKKFFSTGESGDYVVTMQLNNKNEFIWNKYNDAKNNHVIGTYEFKDLHKTNYGNTADYYQITLNGEEYVINGETQNEPYKAEYEMGISKSSDEAIIINVYTSKMYSCYRSDKNSKKIK